MHTESHSPSRHTSLREEDQPCHIKSPGKVAELLQTCCLPRAGVWSNVPTLAFRKTLPVLALNPWG